MSGLLERLCPDACCAVFAFLCPAAAATVRGCSRALLAHPNWAVTSRLWRIVAARVPLINVFAHLEGIASMRLFDAIYALPESDIAAGTSLVLTVACGRGWLKKARWVVGRFQSQCALMPWSVWMGAFRLACQGGHLATAQWLAVTFEVTSRSLDTSVFERACVAGHLDVVQWLKSCFDIPPIVYLRTLPIVCEHDRQPVVEWLVGSIHQPIQRGARNSNVVAAVHAACRAGRLAIAQYLVAAFKITPHTMCGVLKLLDEACGAGHLAIAQWLIRDYYYDTNMYRTPSRCFEARSERAALLQTACGAGQLEMAQWLENEFKLDGFDIRMDNNRALRLACTNGHLEVAQWLVRAFGLSPADAHVYAPHARVVAWLTDVKK
jgi:hypothetical protein